MVMLGEVFYWVLNMSILGGVAGLVILVLRQIKKIPKQFVYVLWVIPFIRFIFPFGMTYRYSLMTLISNFTSKTVAVYESADLPALAASNFIMAAKDYFPLVYKTDLLETVFSISSVVWVVIACAALLTTVLLYLFTKAETRNATRLQHRVYVSDRVTAPALYGIIHPRIIIPQGVAEAELSYILKHEMVHAKRKDNLWRCAAIAVCCLHWFNPLTWLLLKYFFEDMELSCDNKAIRTLTENEQKEYACAILNSAAQKNMLVAAFGGAKIKVRIEYILSYRKLTVFSCICFCLFVAAIVITLLTNAQI